MSLGRSSRFYLLGLAKVKSEKVLSSFASASSIIIHHGSKLCCRTLDTDVGKTLMNMEMLKFLRARTSATSYHRHKLGFLSVSPAMLRPFQTVNSLPIVGFFPSYQNRSQHLHFVPSLHHQCAIQPWVPSISGDKQIHPLRCLQQGNPHHPSPSMPFYRPPPNDRSRIALGWFKEFQ